MNQHRALYRLEVGVPLPTWRDLSPAAVSPVGTDIPRVGPRAYRALSRTQSVELLTPSVDPYPRGSGWVRDELELSHRVHQARQLHAHLSLSSHPWAHLEADQSRKIVLQRGGSPGWFILPDGLIRLEGPPLSREFGVIRRMLSRAHPGAGEVPRYKMGTVHGYPDYLRTHASFLMHALWAAASWDFATLKSRGASLAGILGEETPFSAIMFTRTGPLGKPVKGLSQTTNGAVIDCELQGLCCRRRVVFGMPSAGNMWQLASVAPIKRRLSEIPYFYHQGPAEVARKVALVHQRDWEWYSDDISGYDQSVCDTHQRELADVIYGELVSKQFAAFKKEWKDVPLLAPPVRLGQEAFSYTKKGMTPSGDLTTALDGTLINAARVLRCVARASGRRLEEVAASWGSGWCAFIQGDDTVIGFPKGFLSISKYQDASLELGYSTKVIPGVVFLMHLINPETGAWCPLASRVYQQTVFNEYGGIHPAVELFSFMARATPQFWSSNPWATEVAHLVEDGEAFKAYGVRPASAHRALSSPVFMRDLERELRLTPKADERFGGVSLPGLSDAVHRLIAPDAGSVPLPLLSREAAWQAAMRVAAFLAIPAEERTNGDEIPGLGPDLSDYYHHILQRKEA